MAKASVITVLLCALLGITATETFKFTCPDGWSRNGPYCYKLFTNKMEWTDAAQTCKNYGSELVPIYGYEDNKVVAELVKTVDQQKYWIGFSLGSDSTQSDKEGYWSGNQPNPLKGDCAYVHFSGNQHYEYSWNLANCRERLHFICETHACLEGYYRCANGRCIKHAVCDGEDDCNDASDEADCPSNCKYYVTDTNENIEIPNPYLGNSNCQWTIEGPVGTRLQLTFSRLVTEKELDEVEVWVGGPTETTSRLLKRLSGDMKPADLPVFYSPNNFMIVRFRSDMTVQRDGFVATWEAVTSIINGGKSLAALDTVKTQLSPGYPNEILPGLRESWIISAKPMKVISVQVWDFDLCSDSFVEIRDGDTPSSPLLTAMDATTHQPLVISTTNRLLLYLHTSTYCSKKGIRFNYRQGCHGQLTNDRGVVMSPGYGVLNYPNLQVCTWRIESPTMKPLNLVFDSAFSLEPNVDILEVYEGVDASGTLLQSGTTLPGHLTSSSGQFFLRLKTNSITNGKGFKADFFEDCPDPSFNGNTTVTPSPYTLTYLSQITVTCPIGYFFAQIEHAESDSVKMICDATGWNVGRTPQCHRMYCGLPPTVPNGYISSSTGVQFGDTVIYGCYGGYGFQNVKSVKCDESGSWSTTPVCEVKQCGSLMTPTNGNMTLVNGDGTSYSTVFEFTCDNGYTLSGSPILLCTADDWSHDLPKCIKKHCPRPVIEHAFAVSPEGVILLDETLTVTCGSGYELSGAEVITCQADQTFDTIPTCIDINECVTSTHDCDHACENTDGSYTCSCFPGYRQIGGQDCSDIQECAAVPGICDEKCLNSYGSYKCECFDNRVLYTENGTSQFLIPTGETGLLAGDIYHINHTCVRRDCPTINPPDNGQMLTTSTVFLADDIVHFVCVLGYTLSGKSPITCQADGTWTDQPPVCQRATCPIPDTSVLQYPPVYDASAPVEYLEVVNVTCTHKRPIKSPLIFTRQCLYDQDDDTYKLEFGSPECPIIDCGEPDELPGASLQNWRNNDTAYGDAFDVVCKELFTLTGGTNSPVNNKTVECKENGRWDWGDIACIGATCSDPGTPPGTVQTPESRYEDENRVHYSCINLGFNLTSSSVLTCQINGSVYPAQIGWDSMPPECTDITPPVFSGCPTGEVVINKLTSLADIGFVVPTVSDNTGADQNSLHVTVVPANFSPEWIIIDGTLDVIYTAVDFNNNEATCNFTIRVRDDVSPQITKCPESYTYNISGYGDTVIDCAAQEVMVDPSGVITYDPPMLTVNRDNLGQNYIINVTAVDSDNNTDSCSFMIHIAADKCVEWAVDVPRNGYKSCTAKMNDSGWDCIMTCHPGYYFYDYPSETSVTVSCNLNEDWSPSTKGLHCTGSTLPQYQLSSSIQYTPVSAVLNMSACQSYYTSEFKVTMTSVTTNLAALCEENTGLSVEYIPGSTTVSAANSSIYIEFTLTTKPDNFSESLHDTCSDLLQIFINEMLPVAEQLKQLTGDGASCPDLSTGEDKTLFPLNDFVCSTYEKRFQVSNFVNKEQTNVYLCLPCPIGTMHVGDAFNWTCLPCPLGQYQDQVGQATCKSCGLHQWTYDTGSISLNDCKDDCSKYNMRSDTSLPPCTQCDLDTYLNNSECVGCPLDTHTHGRGKWSESQCQALCTAGTYSAKGYAPCMDCPLHHYQQAKGKSTCEPCSEETLTNSTGTTKRKLCEAAIDVVCGSNSPCQNGGTCSVSRHRVLCTCVPGFTGTACETEINYCDFKPCYNGATCERQLNGVQCKCPPGGYGGFFCEIDPDNCANQNCSNRGQCQDLANSFKCLCNVGYTGDTCQNTASICDQDPCKNGGSCVLLSDTRKQCSCLSGFTGQYCETNIDECSSRPCLYSGECRDDVNGFKCICPDNYGGNRCQNRPDVCSSSPCSSTGVCFDDYKTNQVICACNKGYTNLGNTTVGTWIAPINDVSFGLCDQINFCDSSPCSNGASCSSSSSGFKCACLTGYGGSKCQHDIDDCADGPCKNDATCLDLLNDYNCTCLSGYEGKNCELNINDCEIPSYPCSSPGTDESKYSKGCEDLVNSYKCHCHPGYNGINCSNDILECESSPCFHNGTCKDKVNDYSCDCPSGWDGKRCENIVNYCFGNACQNGGTCYSVFGDYYCDCPYPYHGKDCTQTSNVCLDANPCVGKNSRCVEPSGTCSCPSDHTGDGCHIALEYCTAERQCEHNGICKPYFNGYSCFCSHDFEGQKCETSKDDCMGVSCTGGNCVDGVSTYYCECPMGKAGQNCNKDIDTDFDLCFFSEDKTSLASLAYPFEFGAASFSIGMWVRFSETSGTGTFFSLYGMSERNMGTSKRELVRVDHGAVHVNFDNYAENLNFNSYNINDLEWYYVMVLWKGSTGELDIRINSVSVVKQQNYLKNGKLPAYGLIMLGAHFDLTREEAIPDQGFRGCISQVNVWNRTLTTSSEIPLLVDNRNNPLPIDGLVLRWSNYINSGRVQFLRPSTAGDNVCPEGYSGSGCNVKLADKTPPEITCPDTVHAVGLNRLTRVSWTEPIVKGGGSNGSPVSVYLNSRVLLWGKKQNTYVVYDDNGNIGMCSFDIFVHYKESCPAPSKNPVEGTSTCDNEPWPFRTCTPKCNSGKSFSLPRPNFDTCGPEGSFYVNNIYLSKHYQYPPCSPTSTYRIDLIVSLVYENIIACDSLVKSKPFRIRLLQICKEQWNSEWKRTSTGSAGGGFDPDGDCDSVLNVTAICSGGTTRRKRATSETALVTMIIRNLPQELYDQNGNSLTPEEIIQAGLFDNNLFDFTPDIPNGFPNLESSTIESIKTCTEPGQVLLNEKCVECGQGTYKDDLTNACELCPIGFFQNATGQSSCQICPDQKTTATKGSQSVEDCYTSCSVGAYFTDSTGCVPCEIGFYQNLTGQVYCYPCDFDKTTSVEGSSKIIDCYEICPDGTELGENGICYGCERGTYRTLGNQDHCESCPHGFTTSTVNSTLAENCNIPDCQPGYQVVGPNCSACPLGTYQPEKWQNTCIACPENKTTLHESRTNVNDCIFYCTLGYEENPEGSEQCRPCQTGFFKDNDLPGKICLPCDGSKPGYTTPSQGSTSLNNCTIKICDAGQKSTDDNAACVNCSIGTYQPNQNQADCIECGPGYSTMNTGATSQDECIKYCPSGEELDIQDQCVSCGRGYYKDNDVDDIFGPCQLCPLGMITADIGATEDLDCNIANCSEGDYRDTSANDCKPCPVGTYQPYKWMDSETSCIACDNEKTTSKEASTSEDDCLLDCNPGNEDREDNCKPCLRGYYKSVKGAEKCILCPPENVTEDEGATNISDCNVGNCTAGQYVTLEKTCDFCPRGTYQDKKWQSSCKTCPLTSDGKEQTTLGQGKTSAQDCILFCDDGLQYYPDTGSCTPCPIGYYREKTKDDVCMKCPDNKITDQAGSITVDQCIRPNCSAGYMENKEDRTCIACPRGTYQPEKWQYQCDKCKEGKTTITVGSEYEGDCKPDCPSGKEWQNDKCVECERGYYRDPPESYDCEKCPSGLTTPAKAATSVADCSMGDCGPGKKVVGKKCELCPTGYYQPQKWQTDCISCGDQMDTGKEGATSEEECYSTDECTRNSSLCSLKGGAGRCIDTSSGYECLCAESFIGSFPNCTHACQIPDYCQNGGTCQTVQDSSKVVCKCTEKFKGDLCDERALPQDMTPYIIGGSVGGFVLLILLILLCIWIAWCMRSGNKPKPPPVPMPTMLGMPYEQLPHMVKPNNEQTGTLADSLGRSMHSLTLFQADTSGQPRSLAGYSTKPNSQFLFHEDEDDAAVMAGFGGYNQLNGFNSHDPYEEKPTEWNFDDDDSMNDQESAYGGSLHAGYDETAQVTRQRPNDIPPDNIEPAYATVGNTRRPNQ